MLGLLPIRGMKVEREAIQVSSAGRRSWFWRMAAVVAAVRIIKQVSLVDPVAEVCTIRLLAVVQPREGMIRVPLPQKRLEMLVGNAVVVLPIAMAAVVAARRLQAHLRHPLLLILT